MNSTTDNDRYMRLSELANYSSLSVRTLTRFIKDPVHPLPAHRIMGRTLLVKRSEFDQWVREREQGAAANTILVDEHTSTATRAAYAVKGYALVERNRHDEKE
jgi:excisionase family DNA binding protein